MHVPYLNTVLNIAESLSTRSEKADVIVRLDSQHRQWYAAQFLTTLDIIRPRIAELSSQRCCRSSMEKTLTGSKIIKGTQQMKTIGLSDTTWQPEPGTCCTGSGPSSQVNVREKHPGGRGAFTAWGLQEGTEASHIRHPSHDGPNDQTDCNCTSSFVYGPCTEHENNCVSISNLTLVRTKYAPSAIRIPVRSNPEDIVSAHPYLSAHEHLQPVLS